jgi:hypothetical protein
MGCVKCTRIRKAIATGAQSLFIQVQQMMKIFSRTSLWKARG